MAFGCEGCTGSLAGSVPRQACEGNPNLAHLCVLISVQKRCYASVFFASNHVLRLISWVQLVEASFQAWVLVVWCCCEMLLCFFLPVLLLLVNPGL